MPPAILLLTDDPARSQRLMRDLGTAGTFTLRDIFDGRAAPVEAIPWIVLSDVDLARSDAILPLRRQLAEARKDGAPYICLLRTHTARANIQATALGASKILNLGPSVAAVIAALNSLSSSSSIAPVPVDAQLAQVRAGIAQMLTSDEPPPPEAAAANTDLVLNVLAEVGVSEWLDLVRQFDNMTHQHCLLVAGLAGAFGTVLGFRASDLHFLTKAALLHDVGKARIPKEILNKAGPLDTTEMRIMRRHAEFGYEMLLGNGYSNDVLAVVRSHHEYLDGSGYPDGLRGGDIPDLVRLVTISDIYAALVERRPYRAPMKADCAYGALTGMTGKLDMTLVTAFRPITSKSTTRRHNEID